MVSSLHEVAFEATGAAALVCILMAEEWDTEMPRRAHRSKVSALAPQFNSNKLIQIFFVGLKGNLR